MTLGLSRPCSASWIGVGMLLLGGILMKDSVYIPLKRVLVGWGVQPGYTGLAAVGVVLLIGCGAWLVHRSEP